MPTRILMQRHRRPALSKRAVLALVPLVLFLAVTGCGADTDSGETDGGGVTDGSGESDVPQSQDDMALAFAQCMRDNGVDEFPDPEAGGKLEPDIVNDPDFKTAEEACAEYMGDVQDPDPEDQREMQDTMLAFAQCMRENGVENFPDPDVSGGGGALDEEIANDADFAAADEECRDLLGGALRRGPGQ